MRSKIAESLKRHVSLDYRGLPLAPVPKVSRDPPLVAQGLSDYKEPSPSTEEAEEEAEVETWTAPKTEEEWAKWEAGGGDMGEVETWEPSQVHDEVEAAKPELNPPPPPPVHSGVIDVVPPPEPIQVNYDMTCYDCEYAVKYCACGGGWQWVLTKMNEDEGSGQVWVRLCSHCILARLQQVGEWYLELVAETESGGDAF